MKKEIKTAFPVSSVWFGALVGPSMVSGAFSAVYFAPYGAWGIMLPVISMGVVCIIVVLAAEIVRKNKTYDYASFAEVIYGKFSPVLIPLLDFFMILAMVVGGSAVITMSGSFFGELFHIKAIYGSLIMAVAGIALDIWGARLVRASSAIMTPLLIIGFIALAGTGIFMKAGELGTIMENWSTAAIDLPAGVKGAVLLGFSNLGMATSLCSVEQEVTRRSESIAIGVCSLIMNSFAFIIETLFLLPFRPGCLSAPVPALYIIDNFISEKYPWIKNLYLLIMFLALLSSSAPQLHAVSSRVKKFFKPAENESKEKKRSLIIGICYMTGCVMISFLGLYTIISKGYSMLAELGIPLIALPVVIYSIRSVLRIRKN